MNTFGHIFRFTGFGRSHGIAVGGVIDGCPAGIRLDMQLIAADLHRRAMGDTDFLPDHLGTSARAAHETDEIEWLSGLKDGITLGTPIAFLVRNINIRSADYADLQHIYRPGHADYTYQLKYGIRDANGGGRASARETVARVIAGSIAKQLLSQQGITVVAHVAQVGTETTIQGISRILKETATAGDSIGGIVACTVQGLPAGVGEPIFDKLSARLAYAVMSINGCKGFDYGSGFEGVGCKGSCLNDAMPYHTNHAGGILGGISNGQNLVFRAVFKPTPSISCFQQTIDMQGNPVTLRLHGRHDTCIALRAPVIVEAMTALTLTDLLMVAKSRTR